MTGSEPRPIVVVGVDGSDGSRDALRWAARHARLIGAEVHAVTGWDVPATIFVTPTYHGSDYQREARSVLEATVEETLGKEPDVPVELRLVQDRAALALTREAKDAELLVVGSQGRAGLPGMHLGSVANYVVHHAPCPVVVVRPRIA